MSTTTEVTHSELFERLLPIANRVHQANNAIRQAIDVYEDSVRHSDRYSYARWVAELERLGDVWDAQSEQVAKAVEKFYCACSDACEAIREAKEEDLR